MPSIRSPLWRRAVVPVVAALGISLVTVPGAAVAAPEVAPTEVTDDAGASAAAIRHGKQVRVGSKTSETTEVLANPDGSFTYREHLEPERVKRDNGWVPVDLPLVRTADGSVVPKATPVDVRMSGGGKGNRAPLAMLARDGKEVGLGWQGDLPAPVLSGPTATYPEVLPGVDLVVKITKSGFNQVLVVKSAQAAKNPALKKITFASHTKGVQVAETPSAAGAKSATSGGLRVTDPAGATVFRGDATRMWDSSGDTTAEERLTGPGNEGRAASMDVQVDAATLAVTPDEKFLTDSGRTFPVYIDPSYHYEGKKNHHVVMQEQSPEARNYDRTDGDLGDLKAGWWNVNGVWGRSQSLVEMNVNGLQGKVIHSATLHVQVINSAECAKALPFELVRTDGFSQETRWNVGPSWHESIASSNQTNNPSFCPSHGGVDFNVHGAVAGAAGAGASTVNFGLRAVNEMDNRNNRGTWRRFALNPVLEATYNSRPNVPSNQGIQEWGPNDQDALPCVIGGGVLWCPPGT